MEWIIYFVFNLIVSLIIVPFQQWKELWPAGIVGMLLLFEIDSTLIGLGAYSYAGDKLLSGVPIFYLLGRFFQGVFFAYFYPQKHIWLFPYVLLMAFFLWLLEVIMLRLGYFTHLHWNLLKSYILDVFGLSILLFYSYYLGAIKVNKRPKT